MANHLSNSTLLTNRFKFFEAVNNLESSLNSGYIQSDMYQSTNQFVLETYCLHEDRQLL